LAGLLKLDAWKFQEFQIQLAACTAFVILNAKPWIDFDRDKKMPV